MSQFTQPCPFVPPPPACLTRCLRLAGPSRTAAKAPSNAGDAVDPASGEPGATPRPLSSPAALAPAALTAAIPTSEPAAALAAAAFAASKPAAALAAAEPAAALAAAAFSDASPPRHAQVHLGRRTRRGRARRAGSAPPQTVRPVNAAVLNRTGGRLRGGIAREHAL